MANTYEAIATVEVGSGGAANIEFTSIAADWTDLLVKVSARTDAASARYYLLLSLNNSAATAISRLRLMGFDGTNITSSAGSDSHIGALPGANNTASTFGNTELYIPNYASSNYKSISSDSVHENNSATSNTLGFWAGLWSSTSAVTSVKLTADSGNFVQYSTATLYGIKNS